MPYYRNIALLGKARSGKDTVAGRLVDRWGFRRIAFADPLKSVVLDLDPFIPTGYGVTVRLSRLIADVGWEYAKDTYPEVRRILQHSGQAVRQLDAGFWVRAALNAVDAVEAAHLPVVVTDVRYANEARALVGYGFTLVRVVRPSAVDSTVGAASRHPSETELDDWPTAVTLHNVGTLADLHAQVDQLPTRRP
ncbi:deoxynucleoside monophosphate kinase [Streptomyces phage TG1]|uniref:Deoxynucleoside monophosphate kinase n=1 Tax=Streptomyces phage TG1 TaxID=2927987 RepID=K4HYJ5_9CAUD|nr:deoxynucleoside monophosphate kinase [Streptomyces phage TG1]AFU62216.1 deoxynucleoside monophosphate kinase [Streptomyces phage TG1]